MRNTMNREYPIMQAVLQRNQLKKIFKKNASISSILSPQKQHLKYFLLLAVVLDTSYSNQHICLPQDIQKVTDILYCKKPICKIN